jgi:hypothetical protein
MKNKKTMQTIGLILLTAFIAFGMVWVDVYQRSAKYYKEGEALFAQGKLLEAVTSYETSAHAYTPINSYVNKSMDRLWEIGQRLEKEKDDPDYALIAYRSLRSSVYAIRSFYMPYKEWIPKCDERIQALVEIQKARLQAEKDTEPAPAQ